MCCVLMCFYSHCRDVGYSFEAGGVTDHLVQGADNVCEAGSYVTVLLPTVEHQLVQGTGAVHRRGQAVVLFNGINHLGEKGWEAWIVIYSVICIADLYYITHLSHTVITTNFLAAVPFLLILSNHMPLLEDRARKETDRRALNIINNVKYSHLTHVS